MEAHLIFKDCKTVNDCAEKLNAEIEKWPVVYGTSSNCGIWKTDQEKNGYSNNGITVYPDTHVARLAFVEEIKKEPCKHEPYLFSVNAVLRPEGSRWLSDENYRCIHCQVPLQATWSEKK